MSNEEPNTADSTRRCALLDAALAVFGRFGFRKTSMEEIARAAHLSRQGLYLHFSSKEELFKATVENVVQTSLREAMEPLANDTLPLQAKLVAAFDAWLGRFVGVFGTGAEDLMQASQVHTGTLLVDAESTFLEAVGKCVRTSGLLAAYKPSGVTASQIAETLHAAARGIKHGCGSRDDFHKSMTKVVRVVCAPLREAR